MTSPRVLRHHSPNRRPRVEALGRNAAQTDRLRHRLQPGARQGSATTDGPRRARARAVGPLSQEAHASSRVAGRAGSRGLGAVSVGGVLPRTASVVRDLLELLRNPLL